jgi:hypothetical protein
MPFIKFSIMIRQSFLREALACLLIVLFTYTAIRKFTNPWPFAYVLRQIPLVQKGAGVFVWLVPCFELITTVLLVFPSQRKAGFMFSLILMTTFSIYVGAMLVFSSHLPCSCGGVLQLLNWPEHLTLNLLLTSGSYWGWCTSVQEGTFGADSFQPT